ncbi:hypothetical protein JIN77_08820 [Verrucomicrobiaceae bacterium R5-34]|nr:hypothetical protein [Verrucomicrobiaceae bacterium R5-34]
MPCKARQPEADFIGRFQVVYLIEIDPSLKKITAVQKIKGPAVEVKNLAKKFSYLLVLYRDARNKVKVVCTSNDFLTKRGGFGVNVSFWPVEEGYINANNYGKLSIVDLEKEGNKLGEAEKEGN